ncbi:MAG: hypothetical protein L3J39_19480 [Verrucomicrobiales bacterium]|nr:hypothetical protein [Verrucomicrobiales bacterium]
MSSHDYPKIIARSNPCIESLCNALLQEIVVQVVDPEFNALFLKTDKGVFAIQGTIGSEIVEIVESQNEFPAITTGEGSFISRHLPFERFIGHQIESIREIGEAWNGHGYEISFSNIFDSTMIVQSIYSPPKPDGLEDCLRLGVASYENIQKPNNSQHRIPEPPRSYDSL